MKKKKIFVTGNLGYIGTVLTNFLINKYDVVGYDIGYFKNCLVSKLKNKKKFQQIINDIKNISSSDLKNIDTVIHLASLSNDPLGELNKKITIRTNNYSTIRLAKLAKKVGVKRFIYVSTQSLYGVSNTKKYLTENSKKSPVTTYAITKFEAEKKVAKLASSNFRILIFRPATVFGPSPRFRSDIILNNFVGSAVTTKKIKIFSDGKPWRPILHIDDMCKILKKSIEINITDKINGTAFNMGVKNGNYTVKKLAELVKKTLPGTNIIFEKNPSKDERTYKVSFNKLYKVFGKNIIKKNLVVSQIKILAKFMIHNKFSFQAFTSEKTNRILRLKKIFK